MPFKKGQVGNPNGRPKSGKSWAELLRFVGNQKDSVSGRLNKEVVAETLYRHAKAGNIQAARLIMEYMDGLQPFKGDFNVRFGWIGENGQDHNAPI